MLSDEEKKAIENMKSLLLYSKEHEYFSPFQEQEIDDMNIVLNIVEKQSKEIEELKMQLEIEKIDNKYNQEETCEETIPRYKIKQKIEELKKYRDKFDKRNMLKDVIIKQNQIQVLQSLLEKE